VAAFYFVTRIPLNLLEEFRCVDPILPTGNLLVADLHGGQEGLPLLVGLPHAPDGITNQLGSIAVEAGLHLLLDISFTHCRKIDVHHSLLLGFYQFE
jgi:hypothetical protein